ncbi:S-adenosyl-L-methionine-dependent methyltransferase [Fistulina hepatica ATCC 64428]|nr:S-adenosyl-L-methionine-dependent methyltransferase [Fistulina hepatica ATCC 64428]
MPPKSVAATEVHGDVAKYEDQHVHSVYDNIAHHFSSTRYKPWPIISQFLSSLPPGSIGLDAGTGNGKYLPLGAPDIHTIGLDKSTNLLSIARTAGGHDRDVLHGDILQHCFRDGAFDYAISIATVHHLATPERRRRAIENLIRAVSQDHGRTLVYVWAVEQDELSKRTVPTSSARNPASADNGIDVLVPWVLSAPEESDTEEPRVFNRYYHMFGKGELRALVCDSAHALGLHVGPATSVHAPEKATYGLEITRDGWERSNYYVEFIRWTR